MESKLFFVVGDKEKMDKKQGQISGDRYDDWLRLKRWLSSSHNDQSISEREIWWAAVGENIGIEINGKGRMFTRPVLILKKLSKYGFMGIPLTSQSHGGEWYVKFEFQGKLSYAALSQARVMSVARLWGKAVGKVSQADYRRIWLAFSELYKNPEE